ncbi:MAG: hypothetical protein AABY64_01085 [Bdellovibrionota bacterium]
MNRLTENELQKAFKFWNIKSGRPQSDKSLSPYLHEQIKPWTTSQESRLKIARTGLFLATTTVAKKLNVSHSAYADYEKCEERGSISLATLARVAEAMDCELVYAIRPKSKKYFSQIIWEQLLPNALLHPWMKKCDQRKKSEALSYIAKKFMQDPKFRKKQGWSQRKNN